MRIIEVTTIDGVITPVSELPKNAKLIVCDGVNYTVYEDGDEIPAEFVSE